MTLPDIVICVVLLVCLTVGMGYAHTKTADLKTALLLERMQRTQLEAQLDFCHRGDRNYD